MYKSGGKSPKMESHSRFSQTSNRRRQLAIVFFALVLAFFVSGCKKKVAATTPPPAPPPRVEPATPAAPVITSFEAEPSTVERGTESVLKWSVTGQTSDINISPGIGTVAASATRRVFPS